MKYTPAQYAKVLYDLIDENPSKATETVRAFADKLVADGRTNLLRTISHSFTREWYSRKNITPVEITVAKNDDLNLSELTKKLGGNIEFSSKEDPSIGAGVRIKIGDYQIDNTLARRFSELRNTLTR